MKIIVLIKQVPDTWGERKLGPDGWLDRDSSDPVIDEITERALEVALTWQDDANAEVIVMTMGPSGATDILRKALGMGADSAVHIVDDDLRGADAALTAQVLAAAILATGFDLVIAGNESTDGRGGVVASMVAEILGVASLTSLDSVVIDEQSVSGRRSTEYADVEARVQLPAVISVTERTPEARFANFRGLMKAKKKPLKTVTLAELGVGSSGFGSVIVSSAERPARTAGTRVIDSGRAGIELADFLTSSHLI